MGGRERHGARLATPAVPVAGSVVPVVDTERFREVMAMPESALPLDEAALLIAAQATPVDVAHELARLDQLADDIGARTVDELRRSLFVDRGFRGDRLRYHDPENSYLNRVLDRRLGIPVSLSVLAMVIGRRLDIALVGVGMPGHFLLRAADDPDVFVDAFAGGVLLDEAGCRARFHAVQGEGIRFDPRFLDPVGPRAIVARMLANLIAGFDAAGDRPGVLWAAELRAALPDASVEDRTRFARLLAAHGDLQRAAGAFDALAADSDGELAAACAAAATRLRARLN